MRFASLGGSNAASYVAAGKAVADSAARMLAVQRKASPDYTYLSRAAMETASYEKIAATKTAAAAYQAGIKALNTAKQGAIIGEFTGKAGDIKNKSRMAGILPAVGKIVGSAFKKDPKRPPPLLQAEPVKPEKVEWGGGVDESVKPPELPNHRPFVTGTNTESPTKATATSTDGIRTQAYNYLTKDKGLSHNKALGIMANVDRESGWNPSIRSGDDGGPGGLFQWKGSRQTSTVSQLVDNGNWKGQIDYALSEPREPYSQTYQQTTFDSPQAAADAWMTHWERPADTNAGSKKHTNFLSGYSF